MTALVGNMIAAEAEKSSIRSLWMRGQEKPMELNGDKYRIAAVPLDNSVAVDENAGTVGTLISVFTDTYTYKDLIATFIILHGTTENIIVSVKQEDSFGIYDFILDEAAGKFVSRQRGENKTNVITTKKEGNELAVWSSPRYWSDTLRKYYYNELHTALVKTIRLLIYTRSCLRADLCQSICHPWRP